MHLHVPPPTLNFASTTMMMHRRTNGRRNHEPKGGRGVKCVEEDRGSWCFSIVGMIALRRLHKFPVFAEGVGARAGWLQVVSLSCEAISKVERPEEDKERGHLDPQKIGEPPRWRMKFHPSLAVPLQYNTKLQAIRNENLGRSPKISRFLIFTPIINRRSMAESEESV